MRARENLDDATNLVVASDDRIKLVLRSLLDQVDAILFESIELALRVLIGHARRASNGLKCLKNIFFVDPVQLEHASRFATVCAHDTEQQMFGADKFVLHIVCSFCRCFQDGVQTWIDARSATARDFGKAS